MTKKPFRVTLWFKKGIADADEAASAASSDDSLHPGAVDLLPAEDRYLDDGSVTGADTATFSLRTGRTTYLPRLGGTALAAAEDTDVAPLVRDLKRGRRIAWAVIAATCAALGSLAVLSSM
jgi:hypothetical protein